jgi:hypothetical protein
MSIFEITPFSDVPEIFVRMVPDDFKVVIRK